MQQDSGPRRDRGRIARLTQRCRFWAEGQIASTDHQQCGDRQVLHRGHAAYILVESVEKPTDSGSASLLCWRAVELILLEPAPALPLAHFPTPLHAPGAAATSTEVPGPRAEGRDRTFATKTPIPRQGAPRRGPRSRAGVQPRGTRTRQRLRMADEAFRGPKSGPEVECFLKVSQSAHWG
jgi:hypothetical protein